jgi:ubiquinone/menaquinone biosynthesis C-methylase UbiE
MDIKDYIACKKAYANNINITNFLFKKFNQKYLTSEMISLIYDLQSGSYTDVFLKNPKFYHQRSDEIVLFVRKNIKNITSVLDVGSGELTMFSQIYKKLKLTNKDIKFFATDISLSLLILGRNRLNKILNFSLNIKLAAADTSSLPFATKSIDIIMSDHSLEPNGDRLEILLMECFRVARRFCIFIEPSNSINSKRGVQRMKRLGYIFNLEQSINKLGGEILNLSTINNNYNSLNKAIIMIVKVPKFGRYSMPKNRSDYNYTYPGTNFFLHKQTGTNFLFNKEIGFIFPVIDNVPVLLEHNRILYSNL